MGIKKSPEVKIQETAVFKREKAAAALLLIF